MAVRGRPRAFDRQEALGKAMEVFWVKGYENTSITDLTGAMGINSPSLYGTFTSKEALFQEALEHYTETEGGRIWDDVPTAPSARTACAQLLVRTAAAFGEDSRHRGCMIVMSAPQMEGSIPAICEDLKRRRLETTGLLQERLRRAVIDGELPASVNCRDIAVYIATVQQGMSIQARDGATPAELQAIAVYAMAGWDKLVEE